MQKVLQTTIAGRRFELDSREVEKTMRTVDPDRVRDHFVVLRGRRFPPKQVVAAVTGLDRADFTTYQARSVLRRLGFATARSQGSAPPLSPPTTRSEIEAAMEAEAALLRPYRGRWVALGDDAVLVAADSPQEVLGWLRRSRVTADSMLKVPVDPIAHLGGFPG